MVVGCCKYVCEVGDEWQEPPSPNSNTVDAFDVVSVFLVLMKRAVSNESDWTNI
jgi:hypothetical protein